MSDTSTTSTKRQPVLPTRYAVRSEPVRKAPPWAGAVTDAFTVASRLRGGHLFHPAGALYAATLEPEGGDFLGGRGSYEAVARISKALSLPGGLPDYLGIALHIPTEEGLLDLLFATTGRRAVLRHVLVPRASFTSGAYTTLLPYAIKGRTRILGLLPERRRPIPARLDLLDRAVAAAPLSFRLVSAPVTGPWRHEGVLRVHTPWRGEDLGPFDPELHDLSEIHPTGPFQTFRRLAYLGSRRGRGEG